MAQYQLDGSGFTPIVSDLDGFDVDYDAYSKQLYIISPTKIVRADPTTGQLTVLMEFADEDWGQTASRSIALLHSPTADRFGGGIAAEVPLQLDHSVVSHNESDGGGGIWATAPFAISSTSVVHNTGGELAGGIH